MPGDAPDPGQDKDPKRSGLRGLAKAESMIQIALAVPAGAVLGLLVGGWLDRKYGQHWIAVLGILLGAAGGFVQIFRVAITSSNMKDDDK